MKNSLTLNVSCLQRFVPPSTRVELLRMSPKPILLGVNDLQRHGVRPLSSREVVGIGLVSERIHFICQIIN